MDKLWKLLFIIKHLSDDENVNWWTTSINQTSESQPNNECLDGGSETNNAYDTYTDRRDTYNENK